MIFKVLKLLRLPKIVKMSESAHTRTPLPPSPSLQEVVAVLQRFAPEHLAEKWDNVGLLIEPCEKRPIAKVLMTIDLTEQVVKEAIDVNAQLIISYHPPIFAPLKRITQNTWKERILALCLKNDIAVYSPHTSWDNVSGGINDWLADALPKETSQVIVPRLTDTTENVGAGRLCTLAHPLSLTRAVDNFLLHVGLKTAQLAGALDGNANILRYAVCAGSGASVLKGVQADLYVTGEMSHHEILEAQHNGINVLLLGHSNSERPYLGRLVDVLHGQFKDCELEVRRSMTDVDPLQTCSPCS